MLGLLLLLLFGLSVSRNFLRLGIELLHRLIGHAIVGLHGLCHEVDALAQDSHQQVYGACHLRTIRFPLDAHQTDDSFGGGREMDGVVVNLLRRVLTDMILQNMLQTTQVNVGFEEYIVSRAFTQTDEAEHQMFGGYLGVTETNGLLPGVGDDISQSCSIFHCYNRRV